MHSGTVASAAMEASMSPATPNDRGQMAAFLVRTFGLALYGY
jgi:hypothetical protein